MLHLVAAAIATPFPIAIKDGFPEGVWAKTAALATIIAAFGTLLLAIGTILLAYKTADIAKESKRSIDAAQRAERLRFTNAAILQMVEPEMRIALNNLQGHGTLGDREKAKEMFSTIDPTTPFNERPEPGRSYMLAVGLYDNLFTRISSYAEADIIDEPLYFSQYSELVYFLYHLLKDYVWENPKAPPTTKIVKFATRAFLHFAETAEQPWTGDDLLAFYENRARKYYPGDRTEQALARAREARNRAWFQAYGHTLPDDNTPADEESNSEA